jgi:uncharacterized membrane protein HdeD (DUF308 family)
MLSSTRFIDLHLPAFGKNWRLFMLWGLALMAIGFFAIFESAFTTLLSVVILGFVILFGGCVLLLDTLSFWRKKWSAFFMHLLLSALYIGLGVMLIKNPVGGSMSITLLLGIFYLMIGLLRISFVSFVQTPNWGYGLFNGVISLFLGILILTQWPQSSLIIIGLFVGIDLVFCGMTYVMASLAAKRFVG